MKTALEIESEIASEIRDSLLVSLSLNWEISIKEPRRKHHNMEIKFHKNDSEIILTIEEIVQLEIFENEFEAYAIGEVKCLVDDENIIYLSLDPYDERIDEIDEKDNFVFKFRKYKIASNK